MQRKKKMFVLPSSSRIHDPFSCSGTRDFFSACLGIDCLDRGRQAPGFPSLKVEPGAVPGRHTWPVCPRRGLQFSITRGFWESMGWFFLKPQYGDFCFVFNLPAGTLWLPRILVASCGISCRGTPTLAVALGPRS